MNYLIAGDSWGCGEWLPDSKGIAHTGIQHYLEQDGHTVVNISRGGISNQDIVTRIALYLERFAELQPRQILVFQTEFDRDYKHRDRQMDYGANDWCTPQKIPDIWVARFYHGLSQIAQRHGVSIGIIGGCSDTLWFDDMDLDYPGCQILCQSMINLVLHQDHRVRNPVLSWYTKQSAEFVQSMRTHVQTDHGLLLLLDHIQQGLDRECLVLEHPEWFYPDGVHANRHAHLVLYQHISKGKSHGR